MRNAPLTRLIAAALIIFVADAAQAAPYALDTFLFSANLKNSGNATETKVLNDWLASPAGVARYGKVAATFDFKVDIGASKDVVFQNGVSGQWYLDFAPDTPATPGFFLLKFGTGGTRVSDDTYYFENVADLTKLVWSNEQVNDLTGGDCGKSNRDACNVGRLSHYTFFLDPPVNDAPEPASLALFGLALTGLAFWRRRR
jgi:hypothetical protein